MIRWAIIAVGLIIGMVAVVWIIGATLPRKHTVSVSKRFETPAETLFKAAIDIDGWPKWRSGVDEVIHLDGPGFRAETISGDDRLAFDFDVDFKQLRMTSNIITEDIPFGGEWIIQVEAIAPKQSRITITENGFVDPPIWRFFSKFLIGHKRTAQQFLDDLDAYCATDECAFTEDQS